MSAAAARKDAALQPAMAGDPTTTLESVQGRVEAAFMTVSGKLGEATRLLDACGAGFDPPADGPAEADVAALRNALGPISAEAERMLGAIGAEERMLVEVHEGVRSARTPLDGLDRAIRTMHTVSATTRVAAAGVVGHTEVMSEFADEVRDIAERARVALEEHLAGHVAFERRIEAADALRREFETGYLGRLRRVDSEMRARIEAFANQYGAMRERVATVRERMGRVLGGVADPVRSLQAGDRMEQRLAHVGAALAQAQGAEGAGWDAALRARTLALQAAQLDAVAAQLREEADGLRRSLELLSRQVAEAPRVIRAALDLPGPDPGGRAAAGGIDLQLLALRSELGRTAALLFSCASRRRDLERNIDGVGARMTELGESLRSVRGIEQEMQVLSLNATVRCARVGAGARAMAVIALQLSELTTEIRRSAEAVAAALSGAGSARPEREARGAADNAAGFGELSARLGGGLQTASEFSRRFAAALETLEAVGPEAGRRLQEAADPLETLDGLIAGIERAATQCRALTGPPPEDPPDEAERAVLDRLRAAYTMVEERELHDAFLGIAPAATRAEATPAEGDLDDVFF